MKVRKEKKFISPILCIQEKFRLQKVGVTKVFFIVKVVSDFDFGHFLEKISQRHLETKVLGTKFWSGNNQ